MNDFSNPMAQDTKADASALAGGKAVEQLGLKNIYTVECFGPDGELKWVDTAFNRVVNQGLDDVLDKYLKGSGYTASFFVGLTDGAPLGDAAGDTLASKAWTEVTAYTGDRKALVLGTVSGQSVNNESSKASFAINGAATIGGAFLATVATGTSGILYSVAAFTGGDKVLGDGDTLNVTVTCTAATA
jgi:hypothetical protein